MKLLFSKLPAAVFIALFPAIIAAGAAPQAIPLSELGAKTTAEYKGEAIRLKTTPEGARLDTAFQKLSGIATREGLWLYSTESEGGRLRLLATKVTRGDAPLSTSKQQLPLTGTVSVNDTGAAFNRTGLTEEYSVSVDGVRQDFVVLDRPAGTGELDVVLDLEGAEATELDSGILLTLNGSERKLAYNRLQVTDSNGRKLAARMTVTHPHQIQIIVDDHGAAYPVRIDPTFSDADWADLNQGMPGVSNTVNVLAVDASGNVYVGGAFTVAGTKAATDIAKWNGSSWSALGSGMNGIVNALVVSGTDLYAGGNFTTAGGTSANRIAKWNGSTWSPLGTGVNSTVNALAVSGTDLYVGGAFNSAGGITANCVAKWDGSAWSALSNGTSGTVNALAVNGTNLYAGGSFTTAGGVTANCVAMWNGSAWSALGSSVAGPVNALVSNGTDLYVGGSFTTAGGITVNNIAKWNGTDWSALVTGVNNTVNSLAVSGATLYAGGLFSAAGGTFAAKIAKWDGTAWSALAYGGDTGMRGTGVYALAVSGADLFAAGSFTNAGGLKASNIAKWSDSAWSALGTGLITRVKALAVSGTDIYVSDYANPNNGTYIERIVKWNGSTWTPLGSGGTDSNVSVLLVDGSNVYVGGSFASISGVLSASVAKWNGTSWTALGSGLTTSFGVETLALSGGILYAGGSFTKSGSTTLNHIAKWDGAAWSALGSGTDGTVYALRVIGTDLYAAGSFTTANGAAANRIAKWNGTAWSALGTGMDNTIFALASRDNTLYAGGQFTTAGGVSANRIAKWNGSTWSGLSSGMNNTVQALVVGGSTLYAGGTFLTAGGVAVNRIASWNGATWSALGSGMDGQVRVLDVDAANHLFVGGDFLFAGTTVSPYLAQANNPLAPAIAIEQPTGIPVSSGSNQSFGNIDVGATASLTFTIKNTGSTALNLTGAAPNYVTLTGSSDFSVTSQPSTPVAAAGSTTFTITFTPSTLGAKTTTVSIANDDSTASPFTILLAGSGVLPEIVVEQPAGTDFTDGAGKNFGNVPLGSTGSLTFTIKNTGTSNLTGLTVIKDGTNAGDFSVISGPAAPVAPSGSTTFTVQFAPTSTGLRTAALHIANNDSDENPFDINLSGTGTQPEIVVEQPAGTDLADGAGRAFGNVAVGSTASLIFTIKNSGTDNLTGLTITKDGTNAADFTVIASPAAPVTPGGSTTFTIQFAPSVAGARTAAIHVASNDSDENPFDIPLTGTGFEAEIAVEQPPGTNIADAASQSFGSLDLGSNSSLTFTIKNSGTVDLTGLTINKDGANSGDFTITSSPTAPVVPGGSTTFTVQFSPLGSGSRTAAIHIASNDVDENPFDITLTGTGRAPEIAVEQPVSTNIADAGSKSFGNVIVGSNASLTFTIKNTGIGNLTGLTITKDGANSGDFTITANPSAPVVTGNSTTFTVQFAPTSGGSRTAAIHIANNDLDENPFDITLTGTGLAPEIAVEQPLSTNIPDSGIKSFGSLIVGTSTSLIFTIKNTGTADLTGLTIAEDGANAADFTVTANPTAPVLAGGSTTFSIQFTPSGLGARTAAIHIANNDTDENPFDIILTGTGTQPEIVIEQPPGTSIADGGTKDFGSVIVGSSTSLTFTLKNIGTANLTGFAITGTTGANLTDFTFTTTPVSPVAPSGSTTFIVKFTPGAKGPRTGTIHIANNDSDENPFDITFTGRGIQPEIVVEQPSGAGIIDGGSRAFGAVTMGSNASLTFAIRNTGDSDLTGLAITIDGDNPADFTLPTPATAPVPPNGSTNFIIRFTPSDVGDRTAFLHIASNDSDESPFDITLTGTGSASPITFDAATYSVNQGAVEAVVKLTRDNGSLAASVNLNTNDGTVNKVPPYAAALAGFDYLDLAGDATKVNFAVNETVKIIRIPLIPLTGASVPNKRFTATISNPDSHALLGITSTATIQIFATDLISPTLTITTPAAPAFSYLPPVKYSRAAPFLVQGIVGDAKGIASVDVQLNDGYRNQATLGDATVPTSVPYSIPVYPISGTNEVKVTAYDLQGNYTIVSRSFIFNERFLLTVGLDTPTTSPDASGVITLSATPSNAATALLPAAANSNLRNSEIISATAIKLTATSKPGFVFSRWLNLPSGATALGNMATFTMPAKNVTDACAVFTVTPFNPPANQTNTFFGLIREAAGNSPSNATEGFFTGTLSATSGAFTGKVMINGVTQAITASFFGDGSSIFTVGGAKQTSLKFGVFTLSLSYDDGTITASLFNGPNYSEAKATRGIYGSASKVPGTLLNSTTKGLYTFHIPAKAQPLEENPSNYPQGDGYGTLSLTNIGAVTMTGTLADGTPITASSALLADDRCPIYVQLPTPGAPAATKGGCFIGELSFDTAQEDTDFFGTDLLWIRPAAAGTSSTTSLYTLGWPNGIWVDAVGALYSTTSKVQVSLKLGSAIPSGNAQLILSHGQLTEAITKKLNITGNASAKIPVNDTSYTLTISAATGLFSGTFTPNWSTPASAKPAFKGIFIQKGASPAGYGYFISNAKNDPNPESGSATLKSNPD